MNNTLWVYVCVRLIFDEWHPPTSPTRTKMEACSRVGCILHVNAQAKGALLCLIGSQLPSTEAAQRN